MDRNTLLNSSRTEFLSAFNAQIDGVIHRSISRLYDKAEKSQNSQVQRQLLDARTLLMRNESALAQHISSQLESLLKRSYQTAYDTFRPSFSKAAKAAPLALLDINTFEDDLRVDTITARFRSESEEQLRDLNIRIAILFERNDIAERENPFRPYLLTRALILGVEEIHPDPELLVILIDQFAEELAIRVASIYETVNQHLSEYGVAAQLQFKSQSMPSDLTNPVGYDADSGADVESAVAGAVQEARAQLDPRNFSDSGNAYPEVSQPKVGKIEQLINMVRNRQRQTGQTGVSGGNTMPNGSGPVSWGEYGFAGNGMGGGGAFGNGGGGMTGASAGAQNVPGSAVTGWLEGAQAVGDTLRRVFLGGGTRAAGQDGSAEFGAAGDAELSGGAVQGSWQSADSTARQMVVISPQLRHALRATIPSSSEMLGTNGEVRNLIIERRDNLNSLAADQHEKMTIDIVAMLFEFILKDHQVPAEVRAQLGRLQFSVLKMALMDSALLTKKSHPARLLVNRIGSISVGLQQIDPTGERISAEICRIVEELLTHDSENPELFTKMLDQLDVFIARELLASNNRVEQAVKVVVHAEQRSQRLNQESARLEKVLQGILITPYLKRFLLDTWAHVIERVERNPAADSTRFRLLVPNLLWSILPKSNRDDRSMLLQIIPIIVSVLREGMSLVAWLPEHQQELLNWLVDAHTTVMRAAISDESSLRLVEIQRHFHEFVYPDAEPLIAPALLNKVDVNRVFLDEAIKELEKDLQTVGVLQDMDSLSELVEEYSHHEENQSVSDAGAGVHANHGAREAVRQADSDGLSDAAPDPAASVKAVEDDILDRLRSGVVVEINLSGSPTKGRLNWISPNSSNLILTINGQEAPSIISVRMFRRMLKNSRARFVEVAPLFERAVQSLLESADLVDLAHAA